MDFQESGKGSTPRRPGLRGVVMADVSAGKERVRKWPKKRGRKLPQPVLDRMEFFRQTQWAVKMMPADMQSEVRDAVKDTPLLPRDLLTSMLYGRLLAVDLFEGGTLFPIQAAMSVSDSLDAIAQTPGSMLFRTNTIWSQVPPGGLGQVLTYQSTDVPPAWMAASGSGGWTCRNLIGDKIPFGPALTIAAPISSLTFTNLQDAAEVMLFTRSLVGSSFPTQAVRLSADNGATFYSGSADYERLGSNDSTTTGTAFQIGGQSNNSRSAELEIFGWDQPSGKPCGGSNVWTQGTNGGRPLFFVPAVALNALELFSTTGGTWTSGQIFLMTR